MSPTLLPSPYLPALLETGLGASLASMISKSSKFQNFASSFLDSWSYFTSLNPSASGLNRSNFTSEHQMYAQLKFALMSSFLAKPAQRKEKSLPMQLMRISAKWSLAVQSASIRQISFRASLGGPLDPKRGQRRRGSFAKLLELRKESRFLGELIDCNLAN